jgi:hypothetical protein
VAREGPHRRLPRARLAQLALGGRLLLDGHGGIVSGAPARPVPARPCRQAQWWT